MCKGSCPSMANMTPAEMLETTYVRFRLSVLSLMLLISAFLFYHVFNHSVSIIVLGYSLIYIIVLNIGMRGATSRSIGMLRFYWVYQLVQLICFVLTVLALVVLLTYSHVQEARMNRLMAQYKHIDGADKFDTAAPKKYHHGIRDLIPYILPSFVFLVVVFSITRSVVLARQLIALIELTNEEQTGDVEMEVCSEKEKPAAAPVQAPSVAVYAPEAVYVMPQNYVMPPADGAYPGQLMPVYVDKFGKAAH